MGSDERRPLPAAILSAAALVLSCGVLSGCESPVAFHRPGKRSPDDPVVGLGAPAPYLSPRPGAAAKDPPAAPPVAPAGGRVY
ncbi:hypothetical protein, partial [Actinomadura bangladeshensis]